MRNDLSALGEILRDKVKRLETWSRYDVWGKEASEVSASLLRIQACQTSAATRIKDYLSVAFEIGDAALNWLADLERRVEALENANRCEDKR